MKEASIRGVIISQGDVAYGNDSIGWLAMERFLYISWS